MSPLVTELVIHFGTSSLFSYLSLSSSRIPFILLELCSRRPLCSRWSFNHRTIANDGRPPSAGEWGGVYLKRSSSAFGTSSVFWPLSLRILLRWNDENLLLQKLQYFFGFIFNTGTNRRPKCNICGKEMKVQGARRN